MHWTCDIIACAIPVKFVCVGVHAGNVQYYVLIFVSTLLNQSVQNLSYKNVCGWLNKWSGIVFSVLLFSIFIYTFCFAVSYSVSFLFTRVQNQNKVCFCFLIFFFAWRRWSFNSFMYENFAKITGCIRLVLL